MVLVSNNSVGTLESDQNVSSKFNSGLVEKCWNYVRKIGKQHEFKVSLLFKIVTTILYNCYFVSAVCYARYNGTEIDWCEGVGMLIILTILVYFCLFYYKIFKPLWGNRVYSALILPISSFLDYCWSFR